MVFEESLVLSEPFDDVLDSLKAALAAQGFGTLTEIDLQATLREKLDKQMPRYTILGACNPSLASRAVDAVPEIGVLLPCNVVVRESDGNVIVEAVDPGLMTRVSGSDALAPIGEEARQLMSNALVELGTGAAAST